MKRIGIGKTIAQYIPEVYNSLISKDTGKAYGWIPVEPFKKPYASRKWAEAAISCRCGCKDGKKKFRIRIETFKCVDVKFEEIA